MRAASGRTPKRRLSPLQREILWLLEEAGAQDIIVILNTLRIQYSYSDTTQLLGEAGDGTRRLWLDGLAACRGDGEARGVFWYTG